METEIWLPVKGFEPRFKISNHGRIISINGRYDGEKILIPHLSKMGYYETQLRMNPASWKVRVHTLVAMHFVEKKHPSHIFVNHLDGNKLNNYYLNLEWTTPAGNCAHAVATGLHSLKGEKHPNAKLTEAQVREIRSLYPQYYHREIAEMFGVSRCQIRDIVNRKNWGWLI